MRKTIANKLNGRKTNAADKALAEMISNEVLTGNMPISKALVESGYTTETQAKKAWAAVPERVLKKCGFKKKEEALAALGAGLTPERQENLVRGLLLKNVVTGKDKATHSAKLLGSDRRVNMWTPDMQLGVINLVPPADMDMKGMLETLRSAEATDGKTAGHWRTIRRADGAEATEWVEGVPQ